MATQARAKELREKGVDELSDVIEKSEVMMQEHVEEWGNLALSDSDTSSDDLANKSGAKDPELAKVNLADMVEGTGGIASVSQGVGSQGLRRQRARPLVA